MDAMERTANQMERLEGAKQIEKPPMNLGDFEREVRHRFRCLFDDHWQEFREICLTTGHEPTKEFYYGILEGCFQTAAGRKK